MDTLILLFLIGILLTCLFPIFNLFTNKTSYLEFPFPFAMTALGWFVPQLIAEIYFGNLFQEAIFKSVLMAFLCFAAAIFGYQLYKPKINFSQPSGNLNKLRNYVLFFSIILLIPFFFLQSIPAEDLEGAWSGRPVMLLFFCSALKYTSLYAFLLWLGGDKSKKVFFVMLVGCFYYLLSVIGGGRKAEALELFFAITGGFYFIKMRTIPKSALLIAGLLFAIFIPSTGEYRSIVISNDPHKLNRLAEINWVDNFKNTFKTTGGEVENYILGLYTIDKEGSFDFGLFHWNSLIQRFVPQQIFGSDLKYSLMAPISKPVQESAKYGHEHLTGQTNTGLLDAFSSFWFLGCLKFLVIGVFFKHLYIKAKNGFLKDKMIYIFLVTSGLHSITHTTDWFVFAYIHLWLFTLPYQKYSNIKWPTEVNRKQI